MQHTSITTLRPRAAARLALGLAAGVVASLAGRAHAADAHALTHHNFREFSPFHATIDPDDVNYPLLEAAVFLATNEQRAAHGLAPVRLDRLLARAARGHARRMAENAFYSHDDPTSAALATPQDRARHAGVANPAVAENIHEYFAIQYESGSSVYVLEGRGRFARTPDGEPIPFHTYLSFAEGVVADWMASPGHRANVLSRDARALGVGLQLHWQGNWPHILAVQDFQLFRDVVPRPGPLDRDREPAPPATADEPGPAVHTSDDHAPEPAHVGDPRREPASARDPDAAAPEYEPDSDSAFDYDHTSAGECPGASHSRRSRRSLRGGHRWRVRGFRPTRDGHHRS